MDTPITPERIADILLRVEQAGEGFRLPLLYAAISGAIVTAAAAHGEAVEAKFLKVPRPTVVLLTDDCPEATGPKRWKQIRRLMRWSKVIYLHATGGKPEHYEMALGFAILTKRVLLIEMQHRHHAEWLTLARGYEPQATVFSVIPPPGQTHPSMTVPAGTVVQ
jgi:hypothetical protein